MISSAIKIALCCLVLLLTSCCCCNAHSNDGTAATQRIAPLLDQLPLAAGETKHSLLPSLRRLSARTTAVAVPKQQQQHGTSGVASVNQENEPIASRRRLQHDDLDGRVERMAYNSPGGFWCLMMVGTTGLLSLFFTLAIFLPMWMLLLAVEHTEQLREMNLKSNQRNERLRQSKAIDRTLKRHGGDGDPVEA